jgi:hypothetical protein
MVSTATNTAVTTVNLSTGECGLPAYEALVRVIHRNATLKFIRPHHHGATMTRSMAAAGSPTTQRWNPCRSCHWYPTHLCSTRKLNIIFGSIDSDDSTFSVIPTLSPSTSGHGFLQRPPTLQSMAWMCFGTLLGINQKYRLTRSIF